MYTLGHSNRTLEELVELLEAVDTRIALDVRRWPTSKRYPWFNRKTLEKTLRGKGIAYSWIPALGGYRRPQDHPGIELFKCYRSPGFQAYATYLAFNATAQIALEQIYYTATLSLRPTILCAERSPWNCHRKIIADWLIIHNIKVYHIIDKNQIIEHTGTKCLQTMIEALKQNKRRRTA